MKMTPKHYSDLAYALDCAEGSARERTEKGYKEWEQVYVDEGLSQERFRWDAFHRVTGNGGEINVSALYKYLNDDHIDTALRKYFGHKA